MVSHQVQSSELPPTADWHKLARAVLDEADTRALAVLGGPPIQPVAGETVRIGSASELLYRLEADFSVDRPHGPADRPHGPADAKFHDGELHRSIHFKTRQGGRFWAHLSLLTLALTGREALRNLGAEESTATDSGAAASQSGCQGGPRQGDCQHLGELAWKPDRTH